MAEQNLDNVVRHLRKLAADASAEACTDQQLIEWFLTRRDEMPSPRWWSDTGRLVLSVCRRVLGTNRTPRTPFRPRSSSWPARATRSARAIRSPAGCTVSPGARP